MFRVEGGGSGGGNTGLSNRHQVLMEDLVVVAVVTKVPRHLEELEITSASDG